MSYLPVPANTPRQAQMSPRSMQCHRFPWLSVSVRITLGPSRFQDQRAAQMRALRGLFAVTLSAEYARHRSSRRHRSFAHEELFHDFFDQVVVDVHQASWLVK